MSDWAVPEFSRAEVDAAGDVLMSAPLSTRTPEYLNALTVINNWRSSHNYPLQALYVTLSRRARFTDVSSLTAQRRKRLRAIRTKLLRFPWLKLSEIQDIGGCRAVLSDLSSTRLLSFKYRLAPLAHELVDERNYIARPKRDGYRSHHLIYRHHSSKKPQYDNLKIEIQLRSKLQHAWATAVETVDAFESQSLKLGRGERSWKRFFALASSAFAVREGTPVVPRTPSDQRIMLTELRDLEKELRVRERLDAYRSALATLQSVDKRKDFRHFILELDVPAHRVLISGYRTRSEADSALVETEKRIAGTTVDAVLVSVNSISSLQIAYPNYFLDSRLFLEALDNALR